MMIGSLFLAAAIATTGLAPGEDPGTSVATGDGVRVDMKVRAHVFEWTVTNSGDAPITTITVGNHHTYNQYGPVGWIFDVNRERILVRRADDEPLLVPGQTETFSARVTSGGAVLGVVPMTLERADGTTTTIAEVWGPRPMPITMRLLVPGLLVGFAGLYTWRSERKGG